MSLLTISINGLITILTTCLLIGMLVYILWRHVFQCRGYRMKNIIYKNNNLILQRLKKGKAKTLVVMGNGWNVSLDSNNRITKHDPIFQIPKGDLKLLHGCIMDYEIITAYFPFEQPLVGL